MTQYCKYTHMQCVSVYEENHAFSTFTDSAKHLLRSTTTGAAREAVGFLGGTFSGAASS